MYACVYSIKMPFPKPPLMYLKNMSNAKTINFQINTMILKWFPSPTAKPARVLRIPRSSQVANKIC